MEGNKWTVHFLLKLLFLLCSYLCEMFYLSHFTKTSLCELKHFTCLSYSLPPLLSIARLTAFPTGSITFIYVFKTWRVSVAPKPSETERRPCTFLELLWDFSVSAVVWALDCSRLLWHKLCLAHHRLLLPIFLPLGSCFVCFPGLQPLSGYWYLLDSRVLAS